MLMILSVTGGWAQGVPDSVRIADTLVRLVDTAAPPPVVFDSTLSPNRRDTVRVGVSWFGTDSARLAHNPYFQFTNPTRYTISVRQWEGKEAIFYTLVALLIFFALIRNGFYRYIRDLFKTFFRTTLRQRQIKDQLLQSPLPSLLLNVFFILSAGMFLALVLQYFRLGEQFHFWLLFLYCVLGLVCIYGVKFILLKFMGWMLQARDAMDTYIFVVFTTNKVMGIALLPFIVLLAFTYDMVSLVAVNLGITVIVLLFVYRFFLSYVSIHRQIRIGFLHFLIYLAAFEIAPLLLINKLLFTILS